jgi:hypothetical protein
MIREQNIRTRIVAFQTHILCGSSSVMGETRMKMIHLLFMNFPDNFPINYIIPKLTQQGERYPVN